MSHYQLLRIENLALGSSTHYATKETITGEFGAAQITAAVFFSASQHFCKVCSVIRDPLYFSGLFFNNLQFVCAFSNFTNSLFEGRLDSSVVFYIVTN
jgi:hypothetical protein